MYIYIYMCVSWWICADSLSPAQVLLRVDGFQRSEILAKRLVMAYSAFSTQLAHQPFYDFSKEVTPFCDFSKYVRTPAQFWG